MIIDITNNKEVQSLSEFDNHHAVFLLENKDIGFKGYISIHRKNPTLPSFGATRMWLYESDIEALQDSLRLSKMMSYKAALADLGCGGGKGVIMGDPSGKDREKFLQEYSRHVDLLHGQFITGTDVGLMQKDLTIMRQETPYIVGFNDNSTELTTLGIYNSIEVCLQKVFQDSAVSSRSFAIQGAGKIGSALVALLWDSGCRNIFISDIDSSRIEIIKKQFPGIKIINPEDIHKQDVDVFSPCALGGVINKMTVDELKCKIIVGGANNQLKDEDLGTVLFKRNILYAPDYIVNSGGLIGVFDEYSNKIYNKQKIINKIFKIKNILNKVFFISDKDQKATNFVANKIAEDLFNNFSH